MTEDTDFREDVKTAIKRNDPDADALRALGDSLYELADRYETTDEVL